MYSSIALYCCFQLGFLNFFHDKFVFLYSRQSCMKILMGGHFLNISVDLLVHISDTDGVDGHSMSYCYLVRPLADIDN